MNGLATKSEFMGKQTFNSGEITYSVTIKLFKFCPWNDFVSTVTKTNVLSIVCGTSSFLILSWFPLKISFGMNPLKTSKQVMTWLCFFPADERTSNWKKLSYLALILVILIAMITIVLGSGSFFVRFLASDLELALYAVFQLSSCGPLLYLCNIFLLSRHRISIIFESLTKIHRLRKKNDQINAFRFIYNPIFLKYRWKGRLLHVFGAGQYSERMDMEYLQKMRFHSVYRPRINDHYFCMVFHENPWYLRCRSITAYDTSWVRVRKFPMYIIPLNNCWKIFFSTFQFALESTDTTWPFRWSSVF